MLFFSENFSCIPDRQAILHMALRLLIACDFNGDSGLERHMHHLMRRAGFMALVWAGLASNLGCGGKSKPSSEVQDAWNIQNDPLQLGENYKRTLGQLPLEGSLKWAPWPDSYWPSNRGGIAARWRTGEDGFKYSSPNLSQLAALSLRDRSLLSPAEKYDAFRGDFSYSMVAAERRRTNPNAQSWEGLCHGWAQASLLFQEPTSVLVRSVNGIDIPFGASDIKAILSVLQGEYARTEVRSLGGRCNADFASNPGADLTSECRDVNAGAFHIVIANQIGIRKQGFVADFTRDRMVWNQPVYAYKTTIMGYQQPVSGSARGTVKEAVVRTEVKYSIEILPTWDIIFPRSNHFSASRLYDYRLELDAQNNIIGGEWISPDRPDFIWTQGRAPFTGTWEILKQIYEPSMASGRAIPDPLL